MLQAMAELMKERHHFSVRQEGRLIRERCSKVAREIASGVLSRLGAAAAADALVHPGSSSLVLPRVWIQIEKADRASGCVANRVGRNVRMPGRDVRHLLDPDSIKALHQRKHPRNDFVSLKVGPQIVFGKPEL